MKANDLERDTAVWLLNLANDMRAYKNDQKLVDLPISIAQNSEHCIIANAFNYGCSVDPGSGIISFQTQGDREAYLKVMGMNWTIHIADEGADWPASEQVIDVEQYGEYYDFDAPMSDDLITIAEQFDENQMFSEYNEDSIAFAERAV